MFLSRSRTLTGPDVRHAGERSFRGFFRLPPTKENRRQSVNPACRLFRDYAKVIFRLKREIQRGGVREISVFITDSVGIGATTNQRLAAADNRGGCRGFPNAMFQQKCGLNFLLQCLNEHAICSYRCGNISEAAYTAGGNCRAEGEERSIQSAPRSTSLCVVRSSHPHTTGHAHVRSVFLPKR
jgi:hypothetical protein